MWCVLQCAGAKEALRRGSLKLPSTAVETPASHTGVPARLLMQLPASGHCGKQEVMAQVARSLPLTWENQMEFEVTGFGLGPFLIAVDIWRVNQWNRRFSVTQMNKKPENYRKNDHKNSRFQFFILKPLVIWCLQTFWNALLNCDTFWCMFRCMNPKPARWMGRYCRFPG